jgi:hypothetical protein
VILSPLVTLPISGGILFLLPSCGIDEPWWQLGHLRLALLPGLVDLVAFVWLVSANIQVKKVAATAGVMGVVRVALPQLAVGLYAARLGGQASDPECAISVFLLMPMTALMLAVWVVTALIAAFMFWRVTRAASAQPV